jgi:FSR family fosmidomycin resistance protein-like MFS transporter
MSSKSASGAVLAPARQAALAGLLHALVDLSSAFLLFHELGGYSPEARDALIILYNAVAFLGQVPAGALVDRLGAARTASAAGLALVAAALGLAPMQPALAVAAVGAGNALFHAGAGAQVLRRSGDRSAEGGIFVGPGALGLFAGIWLGAHGVDCRLALIAAALAGSLATAWVLERDRPEPSVSPEVRPAAEGRWAIAWLAGAGLFASVAVRAFAGGDVNAFWRTADPGLLGWLAAPAALGKIAGGAVADRLGWLASTAVALAVAAPLLSAGRASPGSALLGMLLLQSTMPVTLKATHRLMPNRPGLAFGLPCSALFLGGMAGVAPIPALHSTAGLAVALVASAALALWALRVTPRRGPEERDGVLSRAGEAATEP